MRTIACHCFPYAYKYSNIFLDIISRVCAQSLEIVIAQYQFNLTTDADFFTVTLESNIIFQDIYILSIALKYTGQTYV